MDCGGFVLEIFMHINNHDNHSTCLCNNHHWKYHPSLAQLITNSKIVFLLSTSAFITARRTEGSMD